MFRNYFITAIRNILRNRIQSFIQVLSLAVGITATILIGMYTWHEFTYDRFHEKFDRIYRLEFADRVGQPSVFGHQIKQQQIPEVENVVRMVNWHGKDFSTPVKYIHSNDPSDERIINIEDYFFCDSTIFEVFSFNFIQGNPKSALRNPYSVVLNQSTARTIFGDRNPVGETLYPIADSGLHLTVTGIIEDVTDSHIEINMLISIVSFDKIEGYLRGEPGYLNNFSSRAYMTYILLPESNNKTFVERRLNDLFTEMYGYDSDYLKEDRFSLRPLKDIYFTTNLTGEGNYCRHGNLKLVLVLLTIAVFILLLAVINYVNLTTARALLRAKEVGIRKVVGSSKNQLISQLLLEAIVVTLLSFFIAITLDQLLIPGFNNLASTHVRPEFIVEPAVWIICIIFVIIIGLISGIYPAFYLTGFQIVASLLGENVKGYRSVIFRRVLLTFQFTISIILIVSVIVIFRQLNYMKAADPGFNKELVINLQNPHRWGSNYSKRQIIKEQLLKNPSIKGVAFSNGIMGGEQVPSPGVIGYEGTKKQMNYLHIDADFFDVLEIKLLYGRNFSWERGSDFFNESFSSGQPGKIIINETAMRELELESPVGSIAGWEFGGFCEIIGVVNDFNFKSLHEKIEPCIYVWMGWLPVASIKIAPTNIPGTLKYIQNEIESLFPEIVFEYSFLEETYARQYIKDEKTARIISILAIVAVLIACLGLFGLSTFMAARRTKEIGIRKSMGASVKSVFLLLSREFLKWVIISVAIACPVGWYIMDKWLQNFAYRTNISWWIFALAILIAFVIAFGTVTWQSLKTAKTNPVEALRYE